MRSVSRQCAKETQLNYTKIDACTKGQLGNQLQHINAVRTDTLEPPRQYVPWLTVNGQHTDELRKQAEEDLIGLICSFYTIQNTFTLLAQDQFDPSS